MGPRPVHNCIHPPPTAKEPDVQKPTPPGTLGWNALSGEHRNGRYARHPIIIHLVMFTSYMAYNSARRSGGHIIIPSHLIITQVKFAKLGY